MIDTIAFEPNPSGLAINVPSSPGKHTVERLTLTADRTRLRYETTVEDPMYLTGPATLTQQWDHRPDLEFSQDAEGCDKEVAAQVSRPRAEVRPRLHRVSRRRRQATLSMSGSTQVLSKSGLSGA